MLIVVGVACVLAGICILYMKYRIVIGGTLHEARFVSKEEDVTTIRRTKHMKVIYRVGFTHEGRQLSRPISSLTPEKDIEFKGYSLVYYNPKYPKEVMKKSFMPELYCLGLVVLGVVMGVVFFVVS